MNRVYILIICCLILGLAVSLQAAERTGLTARSMAYVLQAEKLAPSREQTVQELASSGRDLIVLDYSYNIERGGEWTETEIDIIRSDKPGRKVICYLSIGEAEDYRPYWQSDWDRNKDGKPDPDAPAFLNTVNPDWEGNYKVRYWHEDWQDIILSVVDEIIAQGFDGVYLDVVDAFEFYEYDAGTNQWLDYRKNPETLNTYRQDMVAWVNRIASHGRAFIPDFIVIPQNGAQLLMEPGYTEVIDAIGIEDLFTNGNRIQKNKHVKYVSGFLAFAKKNALPVLLIEYGTKQHIQEHSIANAQANGFTLLLTDRNLKTLGTVPEY